MNSPVILIIEIILTGITVYYTLIRHRSANKDYYRLFRDVKHLISIAVCCIIRFLATVGIVELGGYVLIFDGLIILSIIVSLLFTEL